MHKNNIFPTKEAKKRVEPWFFLRNRLVSLRKNPPSPKKHFQNRLSNERAPSCSKSIQKKFHLRIKFKKYLIFL